MECKEDSLPASEDSDQNDSDKTSVIVSKSETYLQTKESRRTVLDSTKATSEVVISSDTKQMTFHENLLLLQTGQKSTEQDMMSKNGNMAVILPEALLEHHERKIVSSEKIKETKIDIPCCSICLDETKKEKICTLCPCHRLIHLSCLEKWLEVSRSNHCEICKQKFQIRIEKRYSKPVSMIVWIARVCSKRMLFTDIFQFCVIGMLLSSGIYIIFRSNNEHSQVDFTSHLVSIIGASIMILIIAIAYFICCYVTFKQYQSQWHEWYLQCNKVTIVCTPNGTIAGDSHCTHMNSSDRGGCCVPIRMGPHGPTQSLYCPSGISHHLALYGQTDFTTMWLFSV